MPPLTPPQSSDSPHLSLKMSIPGHRSPHSTYYSQKKELPHLQPHSSYDVNIVAFNEYGSSELLHPFTLQTTSEGRVGEGGVRWSKGG